SSTAGTAPPNSYRRARSGRGNRPGASATATKAITDTSVTAPADQACSVCDAERSPEALVRHTTATDDGHPLAGSGQRAPEAPPRRWLAPASGPRQRRGRWRPPGRPPRPHQGQPASRASRSRRIARWRGLPRRDSQAGRGRAHHDRTGASSEGGATSGPGGEHPVPQGSPPTERSRLLDPLCPLGAFTKRGCRQNGSITDIGGSGQPPQGVKVLSVAIK